MRSFAGGAEQQRAFDEIKEYLTKPPVLVPPRQDRPFYIYLSVADTSIASVVVQVYDGLERVAFYISRRMLDAETRYPQIEKLCLCLYFTCAKLRHVTLKNLFATIVEYLAGVTLLSIIDPGRYFRSYVLIPLYK